MPVEQTDLALPREFERTLAKAADALRTSLHDNLHSLVLYGSAVRGEVDRKTSDINLLIVLRQSTPAAHAAIAAALADCGRIEPMIVAQDALPRLARVFALKFQSIRRNHAVLHGADVLDDLPLDRELLVLLCEQELRNLHMRVVRAYVTAGKRHRRYLAFLIRNGPRVVICLSDLLRCADITLPQNLSERVPVLRATFGSSADVCARILDAKRDLQRVSAQQALSLHADLTELLERAIAWMEARWPLQRQ